jgi:hypothetical protein
MRQKITLKLLYDVISLARVQLSLNPSKFQNTTILINEHLNLLSILSKYKDLNHYKVNKIYVQSVTTLKIFMNPDREITTC